MSLREDVLRSRYLVGDETCYDDMIMRVARYLAKDDQQYYDFRRVMVNKLFLPNSPTLMNAGAPGSSGLLSACFILPIEDNLPSIYETLKQSALIQKAGGGIGYSFDPIRPRGTPISGGGKSGGVMEIIELYHGTSKIIKQGGRRAAANMAMLSITHPDILEFIDYKKDHSKITSFNLSVKIPDTWMNIPPGERCEVQHDRSGTKKLGMTVGELLDKISRRIWEDGEPGICFIDTVNRGSPITAESSNPCGEFYFLPYGSCNLGSVNLSAMVRGTDFDFSVLEEAVNIGVDLLNRVIDTNKYTLDQIADTTLYYRPIGLGVMGWADALIKMGVRYGSSKSLDMASRIMAVISDVGAARSASMSYNNCQITTIAPTGSISILAECSPGIEPIHAWEYYRNWVGGKEKVIHPLYAELPDKDNLPEHFVLGKDLSIWDQLLMQKAFQRNTDNGVSKTIQLPKDSTPEQVRDAIQSAWAMGLKGITMYREGSREGEAIASITSTASTASAPIPGPLQVTAGKVRDRPKVTMGKTHEYGTGCGTIYVTFNRMEDGTPCEVFATTKGDGGCRPNLEALGTMISVAFRAGVCEEEIARRLARIRCPGCRKAEVRSCPDAMARAIWGGKKKKGAGSGSNPGVGDVTNPLFACPDCGEKNLRSDSGCRNCPDCGWTKCG